MTTTGFSDTFNRTVTNALGQATSGQVYQIVAPATMYSVTPSTASINPTAAGDKFGFIDLQTSNVDITMQVAISAIPASNLATVGFVAKLKDASNYFNGTMMVATGGAISLRFSKVIAGSTVTIATVATGLTYVAGTFYNLRYRIYWSRALQTNVMQSKLWTVGGVEPGGWMASTTDASFTDYTSGTSVGIMARDESTTVGTLTMRYRSLLAKSYNLPVPATTDPMCADPAVAFPKQTALQSLAVAADAVVATIDPLKTTAGLFPRVRISNTNLVINGALGQQAITFAATEYNVGTSTDLGYNNRQIYLPVGLWMVTLEIQMVENGTNYIQLISFGTSSIGQLDVDMRTNPVQTNDQGIGGCGHVSTLMQSTDPTSPAVVGFSFLSNNNATSYTLSYVALSAFKISDYFL